MVGGSNNKRKDGGQRIIFGEMDVNVNHVSKRALGQRLRRERERSQYGEKGKENVQPNQAIQSDEVSHDAENIVSKRALGQRLRREREKAKENIQPNEVSKEVATVLDKGKTIAIESDEVSHAQTQEISQGINIMPTEASKTSTTLCQLDKGKAVAIESSEVHSEVTPVSKFVIAQEISQGINIMPTEASKTSTTLCQLDKGKAIAIESSEVHSEVTPVSKFVLAQRLRRERERSQGLISMPRYFPSLVPSRKRMNGHSLQPVTHTQLDYYFNGQTPITEMQLHSRNIHSGLLPRNLDVDFVDTVEGTSVPSMPCTSSKRSCSMPGTSSKRSCSMPGTSSTPTCSMPGTSSTQHNMEAMESWNLDEHEGRHFLGLQ